MSEVRFVPLSEVMQQRKANFHIDSDTEYKLCRVQLHRRGVVLREVLPGRQIKTKKQQICRFGDLIVAEMDAKLGGYGFIPLELDGAIVSSHYYLFRIDTAKLDPSYFEVLIQSDIIQDQIQAKGSTNYSSIRAWEFLEYLIPLPTMEIQRRIAKLSKKYKSFQCELDTETSHQESLTDRLRQSILQEAIEGKLTASWRAKYPCKKGDPDRDGAALLEKICEEKKKLVAEGKIRKEKPVAPIAAGEEPFKLPEGWVWCSLGSCSINRDNAREPITRRARENKAKVYPYYGASGIIDQIDGFTHVGNNLLIGEDGANLLARSTPVAFIASGRYWVNNHAHVLGYPIDITLKYICMHINAIDLAPFVTGGFQPKLSQVKLNEIPIALPPLAEQAAIVERVESLLAMVGELEKEVASRKVLAAELMREVLREAFEGGADDTRSRKSTMIPEDSVC